MEASRMSALAFLRLSVAPCLKLVTCAGVSFSNSSPPCSTHFLCCPVLAICTEWTETGQSSEGKTVQAVEPPTGVCTLHENVCALLLGAA